MSTSEKSSLFSLGTALFQNRFEHQIKEYKYLGIEKGATLGAALICAFILILLLGTFIFFGSIWLGLLLSEVFNSFLWGFGIITIAYFAFFIFIAALNWPIRWLLKTIFIRLLLKK